jgi:hypothetical protein
MGTGWRAPFRTDGPPSVNREALAMLHLLLSSRLIKLVRSNPDKALPLVVVVERAAPGKPQDCSRQ